jgi:hypothetical protein
MRTEDKKPIIKATYSFSSLNHLLAFGYGKIIGRGEN